MTAWDPPRRFAYRTPEAEDGRFIAYEFLIEGRGGGSTVLRLVTSGFLPGDDWESEYDALGTGWEMYLHLLGQYLTWFRGRAVTPVTVMAPGAADPAEFWPRLRGGLGLGGEVAESDKVRLTPEGLDPIEGVVDYVSPQTLGVRTEDGLYRFVRGHNGMVAVGHHLYGDDVDGDEAERAWQAWLERLFATNQ